MKTSPFHLSLPCLSVTETKKFYADVIGADLGRNTHQWVDVDLFGNQITFTKSGDFKFKYKNYKFEDTVLPSFHFGVIVDSDTWNTLYQKLDKKGIKVSDQKTFLTKKAGEHSSFFLEDPNGYMMEFKCFAKSGDMFLSKKEK